MQDNIEVAMEHGDTWRLWGPQATIYVPHGILLLQFRIHGKYKGSCMSYKDNKLGNMHHRSNFGTNVTYMGEEDSFWS